MLLSVSGGDGLCVRQRCAKESCAKKSGGKESRAKMRIMPPGWHR
jgi:hypothetical protein